MELSREWKKEISKTLSKACCIIYGTSIDTEDFILVDAQLRKAEVQINAVRNFMKAKRKEDSKDGTM